MERGREYALPSEMTEEAHRRSARQEFMQRHLHGGKEDTRNRCETQTRCTGLFDRYGRGSIARFPGHAERHAVG